MFEDAAFPANTSALGGDGRFTDITWLRPKEIDPSAVLFPADDEMQAEDVTQGTLHNCYFVAALSLLTQVPRLLRRLIVEYNEAAGRFVMRLFMDCEWRKIEIDDRLPCRVSGRGTPTLAFAHSRKGHDFYVALIEKAYAKAWGSYSAIEGGNMGEALFDLTGGMVDDVNLERLLTTPSDKDPQAAAFKLLQEYQQKGALVSCGRFEGEDDKNHRSGPQRFERNDAGIVVNHAYGVLDVRILQTDKKKHRLVRVRNPWESHCGAWTGEWGQNSKLWNKERRSALNYAKEDEGKRGDFWLSIEEFMRHFNRIHACHTTFLDDSQEPPVQSLVIRGAWKGKTAGGCTNYPSFRHNPMLRLEVSETLTKPLDVHILLTQPDERRRVREAGLQLSYPQIGLTLIRQHFQPIEAIPTDAAALTPDRAQIVHRTSFWNKRDVGAAVSLLPPALLQKEPSDNIPVAENTSPEYRLVPSSYFPNQEGDFTLLLQWRGGRELLNVACINFPCVTQGVRSCVSVKGQWKGPTAGGRPQLNTFTRNPCFSLTTSASETPLTIVLTHTPSSQGGAASNRFPPAAVVVLNVPAKQFDNSSNAAAEGCLAQSPIPIPVAASQWSQSMVLKAKQVETPSPFEFFLVPFTHQSAKEGSFELCVESSAENMTLSDVTSRQPPPTKPKASPAAAPATSGAVSPLKAAIAVAAGREPTGEHEETAGRVTGGGRAKGKAKTKPKAKPKAGIDSAKQVIRSQFDLYQDL
ncbi:unnamed protein product [Vitrella brassicaformis CCMP3155]|uniref:Calpain catalytic domain-containing protein n=2 Tax=Vitrella brassicaformis TaxID=1169539 RepID=A0A0G4GCQ6_VITBC|nr:unnamed protein product [Vitrella brassicaformis CCMP3155]|eukprot:CEM26929.1 unnamed protein product [Vitrella brassicaformis CCMP3155]